MTVGIANTKSIIRGKLLFFSPIKIFQVLNLDSTIIIGRQGANCINNIEVKTPDNMKRANSAQK